MTGFPGGWLKVSKTVDPASINATTTGSESVTIKGVTTADIVFVIPPSDLHDDLVCKGAYVSAANTVTMYIYNASGSPINQGSGTWTFLVFRGDGLMPSLL